ncbi:MAG: hypothetical protein II721_00465 [Bacilli bacterium]|nr:hypothetical protein [Bacilli bacterium]
MNNQKVVGIVDGVILIVVGILIAIFGGQAVMNIYFGVAAIIAGVALLALQIYALIKNLPLSIGSFIASGALIAIAIALFVGKADIAGALIGLLIAAVLGGGAGLILYGILAIAKRRVVPGIIYIVFGALMLTFGICEYVIGADFDRVFWITIGVLIAVYGVFYIVVTVAEPKKVSKK